MLKKIWVGLLLLICALLIPMRADAKGNNSEYLEFEGMGTLSSPYLLFDEEDLKLFASYVEAGQTDSNTAFALVNDIVVTNDWIPMGNYRKGISFDGSLDGRGHTIVISKCEADDAAFFELMNGTVKNLTIDGVFIGGQHASTFACYGYGDIINCMSVADVSVTKENAYSAGIANFWNGRIANVLSAANVKGGVIDGITNSSQGDFSIDWSYSINCDSLYCDNNSIDNKLLIQELNNNALDLFLGYGRMVCWGEKDNEMILTTGIAGFDGEGTELCPYIIMDQNSLAALSYYSNKGLSFQNIVFKQVSDITVDASNWIEISGIDEDTASFSGTYYGDGHSISFQKADINTSLFGRFSGELVDLLICSDVECVNNSAVKEILDKNARLYNVILNNSIDVDGLINKTIMDGSSKNIYLANHNMINVDQFNNQLEDLVVNNGIHCCNLHIWSIDEKGNPIFSRSYRESFLNNNPGWLGNGTETQPYLIENINQLVLLREKIYEGNLFRFTCFKQTSDIDISDVEHWISISDPNGKGAFCGNYNGDGNEIECNPSKGNFHSIWGDNYGNIFNVVIQTDSSNSITEGLLVSNNYGILANSIVSCPQLEGVYHIKFCQNNYSTIENCYVFLNSACAYGEICDNNSGDMINVGILDGAQDCDNLLFALNDKVIQTSYDTNRSIESFNSWVVDNGMPVPQKTIVRRSVMWITSYLFIVAHTPLVLFALFCTLSLAIIYLIRCISGKLKIRWTNKNAMELCVLSSIFILFVSALREISMVPLSKGMTLLQVFGICCFGINFAWIIAHRKYIMIRSIRDYFANYWTLMIGMIIIGVIVLHYNSITPCYDADLHYGDYIRGIEKYDGTILGLLPAFVNWGKGTIIQAMLWTVGELFFRGTAKGVYAAGLFLLWIADICVFFIIKAVFKGFSNQFAGVLASIFGILPYVCAGVIYINPDYYALIFFVITVCCFLYDYNYLGALALFSLVCAKPNMIVPYSVFFTVMFLGECKKNVKKTLLEYPIFTRTIPAIVFVVLHKTVFWYDVHTVEGLKTYDYLIFEKDAVLSRVLQYAGYGFLWLIELVFIVALAYLLLCKKKVSFDIKPILAIEASSISIFIMMLVMHQLSLCPRYFTICMIKTIVLLSVSFSLMPKASLRYFAAVTILGVLLIQQFYTIDPLVITSSEKGFQGNYMLVQNNEYSTYQGDLAFYNNGYASIVQDASTVLGVDNYNDKVYIEGLWLDGYSLGLTNSGIYPVYYDMDSHEKTYCRNDNAYEIKTETLTNSINFYEKYEMVKKDKLVLIVSDYKKSWLVDWLTQYGYEISIMKDGAQFDQVMALK